MSDKILDITDKFKKCKEFSSIPKLYEANKEDMYILNKSLEKNPELTSFIQTHTDLYLKVFTIICFNAFEKRITTILPLILSGEINNSENIEIKSDFNEKDYMSSFLKKNSFQMKFHTLFDWNAGNVNKLLGMFEKDVKDEIREGIRKSDEIKEGEKSFISIGVSRNKLVHNGIYEEKTHFIDLEYVYSEYNKALTFVTFLLNKINEILHRSNIES